MTPKSFVSPSWWSDLAKDEKKVRCIVAAGLLGMLLILLGNFWPTESPGEKSEVLDSDSASFVSQTETRLREILSQVQGVGEVDVLVTLESGRKAVYAVNEKQTQEAVTTYADGAPSREEETGGMEQSYLLVDSGGGKSPLVLTNAEPVIRGVVVVCGGAQSPVTREAVMDAVTTALGIGANQVCILKAGA